MRHRKKFNHLGRTSSHRKAMLSNMASSLILHKRIKTTLAKAKALRVYVEPLITKSKKDDTHSRRVVFSHLQNKDAVSELFRDISVKVGDRPGGYTRILKLGNRLGDAAEICYIELVDYNENMLAAKSDEGDKKGTRRSRRRKSSGRSEEATGGAKTKTVAAAPKSAEKATKPVEGDVEVKENKEVKAVAAKEVAEPVEDTKPAAETAVSEPVEDKAKDSKPASEAAASDPSEEVSEPVKDETSDEGKKAE